MASKGGARKGAGRKPKADEEKVNNLFVTALKRLYNKKTDDEAKITFIKDTLLDSQRGQIFVAEHVFGKASQEVVQTNFNIEEKDITPELISEIKNVLDKKY